MSRTSAFVHLKTEGGVREDTSTESGDCSELSQGITDPVTERRVIRREEVEFDSLLSRRDGKAFL